MTGHELRQLRKELGQSVGRPLTTGDMAKLCGLETVSGTEMIRNGKLKTTPAVRSRRYCQSLHMHRWIAPSRGNSAMT